MAIRLRCGWGVGLCSLLAALVLSGCETDLCPDPTPLDKAASYPLKLLPSVPSPRPSEYNLPFNAWVDLPSMAEFIRATVAAEGVDGLVSRYQFRCVPRAAEAGCVDCYTCTRTIPQRGLGYVGWRLVCTEDSQVLVQAAVGPGPTAQTMTYWRVPEDRARR